MPLRLNALLVADAVSAPPDGKFYIHGGGLTRLTVPIIPFPIPQLGVFVRLEVGEDEDLIGSVHEFRFALTDPDGVALGVPPKFQAAIPGPPPGAPGPEPGEQRFVVLAVNLAGIIVGRTGLHTLEFHVDDELLGEVPLPVTRFDSDQFQAIAPALPLPRPAANRTARRHPPRRH
jgi:hypothetical protein